MKCALCGVSFNPLEAESSCAGCAIGKSCGFVRCPNCHYEMPTAHESPLPDRSVSANFQAYPLDQWPIGKKAKVELIQLGDRVAVRKIIAMGALPGAEVLLVKKFPAYVLEISGARFSMDRELISLISVTPCK